MLAAEVLHKKIESLDGKDYGAYQALKGEYDFNSFVLILEHIPKDPYAPPHTGLYRIRVQRNDNRVVDFAVHSKTQEIACRDFLARCFYNACEKTGKGRRGTGYSGIITINRPGQVILERSCVLIDEQIIELRFFLGLPASGRTIKGAVAIEMIFTELPVIVEQSLFDKDIDRSELTRHIQIAEDAEFLRAMLAQEGLIAFIADNAILPRESGSSDLPLAAEKAVPFVSPPGLTREMQLPHAGKIRGMGFTAGVTLIVGGGYHGKSTLLKTIETGVYNHIPGDGREQCVTNNKAVKIRAYSGRSIAKTDISSFINNLPFGEDTVSFATQNASGSTSQAAGIIEAIEIGATLLLMDEDTCATNFMIRDQKMQQLVHKQDEPITTFIDRVQHLYRENGISTILVLGGAGDYFAVSDRVIQLVNYRVKEVTNTAHTIAAKSGGKRVPEDENRPVNFQNRIPLAESVSPLNEYGKKRIYAKEVQQLHFGKYAVDLTDLEQLVELSQTRAIAFGLAYARKYMNGQKAMRQIVDQVVHDVSAKGLDVLADDVSPNFAAFRPFELAFALNRLRGLEVRQK